MSQDERDWLQGRSEELRDLGSRLTAASSTSPYSPDTVNVRGPGDVHVARLLRDAMRQASEDPAASLNYCTEAQGLAPSYYEAWRVEAYVRSVVRDHAGAIDAYDRALELASDSAPLLFHYGSFLLDEAGQLRRALDLLQAGARLDPESPILAGQIAWAHYCLDDMLAAVDSSRHLLTMRAANQHEIRAALIVALRSAAAGIRASLDVTSYDEAAELLEGALQCSKVGSADSIFDESYDRIIQLRSLAEELARHAEGYASSKARQYLAQLTEVQRISDSTALDGKSAS